MILNKRIKRGIRNNLSFYIVSSILTLLSTALLITGLSTGNTLVDSVSDFFEEYHAEDAEFTVYNEFSEENIREIENQFDVLIEKNSYKDVKAEEDSNVRVFKQTFKVNQYCVTQGHDLSSDTDLLITQKYAEEHNIQIGDSIEFGGVNFTVCGYAIKSDYIYMLEKLTDAYRDNKMFGLAIVTENAFDQIDSMTSNYFGILFNQDNSVDVRKYINDEFMINSYMGRDTNTRIAMPLSQGRDVKSMAEMVAPVFFAIVIIIVALVISRIIKKESDVIGTLLALGYKKSKIIRFYSVYGLIPGAVGSLLGLILGILLTGPFSAFFIELDFEPFQYAFRYSIPALIIAIVLPTVLYVGFVVCVSHMMLKKNVIDLIHNSTNEQKTVGILRNSNLSVKKKMQIRELVGHPQKSLVLIAGVLVSAALLTIGLNSYFAFSYVTKEGVADNVKYDYMYVMNSLNKENEYGGEGILMRNFEVEGNTVQISLIGLNQDTKYFDYQTENGSDMDLSKWYMSSAAANTYNVAAGDKFTFRDINSLEEKEVHIEGIIDDNFHSYLYTGNKNVSEILDVEEGSYNAIVSAEELDIEEDRIFSKSTVKMTQGQVEELLAAAMVGVYALFLVGFMLSVFVLYLVIDMTIGEKKASISLLKILGFKRKEIYSMVINAELILVFIGFALGIPAGLWFSSVQFRGAVAKYGMSFDVIVKPETILITLAVILLAYWISTFFLKKKAFNNDMVESLKDFRNE